jgi:hypothetical protein
MRNPYSIGSVNILESSPDSLPDTWLVPTFIQTVACAWSFQNRFVPMLIKQHATRVALSGQHGTREDLVGHRDTSHQPHGGRQQSA